MFILQKKPMVRHKLSMTMQYQGKPADSSRHKTYLFLRNVGVLSANDGMAAWYMARLINDKSYLSCGVARVMDRIQAVTAHARGSALPVPMEDVLWMMFS